jgi:hypothetical protein
MQHRQSTDVLTSEKTCIDVTILLYFRIQANEFLVDIF